MNGRNAPVGRSLILVNAAHPVPASALPERLERVRGVSGGVLLERAAARALRGLVSAVGGDGSVLAVSGFRSREEQAAIWDEAVAENGAAFARSYVARPGCSEHETGLAVDVTLSTEPYDFIRPSFPDEGIGREFRRRAAWFGFIERYRAGEEPVTGIAAEPWHFRYVGAHAPVVEQLDLSLETYVALLRRGTSAERPLRACGLLIWWQPEGEPVPRTPSPLIGASVTNEGGIVLVRRDGHGA